MNAFEIWLASKIKALEESGGGSSELVATGTLSRPPDDPGSYQNLISSLDKTYAELSAADNPKLILTWAANYQYVFNYTGKDSSYVYFARQESYDTFWHVRISVNSKVIATFTAEAAPF